MRSKLSVTVYLFCELYGCTTFQSRSFLKNIENFLCKQKLVNNHSIPSMHAERKNTICSHKYSFTPYPSLGLTDRQNDRRRNEYTRCTWAGGTFFQLCCCVSFWFWREISFGFTYYLCTQSTIQLCCCVSFWFWQEIVLVLHTYLVYNTVLQLCQFFGCGRKQFSK